MSAQSKRSTAAFFAFSAIAIATMSQSVQAQDTRGAQPPQYVVNDENGVDFLTGRMAASHSGISIGDANGGISETFSYLTESPKSSLIGYAYNENYGESARHATKTSMSLGDVSAAFVFENNNTRIVQGTGGEKQYYGGFVFSLQDGTSVRYLTNGFPSTVTKPNGEVWTYYYSPPSTPGALPGFLSIVSSAGYMWHYDGNGGKRTLIDLSVEYCGPQQAVCNYKYNWPTITVTANSVTDSNNGVTRWTAVYGASGYFQTPQQEKIGATGYSYIIGTGGTATQADAGKIVQFNTDKGEWSYSYTWDPKIVTAERTIDIIRQGPNGTLKAKIYHNCLSSLTNELNITASNECTYDYSDGLNNGRVINTFLPEKNYVSRGYDTRGNNDVIRYWDKARNNYMDFVKTYPASCDEVRSCNLPISIKDLNGNITEYKYNEHGQVTLERGPVATSGRVLKLYTYTDTYAWYFQDNSGALKKADTPISLLTNEKTCKTAVNSDATGCDGVAINTDYEYGTSGVASTIRLRAKVVYQDGGVSKRRTCYAYDAVGNMVAQTTPREGLTSCP